MKAIHISIPIAVLTVAALIFVGCGGGSGSSSGSTSGNPPTVVSMTGSHSFAPTAASVSAGGTVQWKNIDVTAHTVASDTGVSGMNSDTRFPTGLAGGDTFNWQVPLGTPSGTVFFYHCEFHGAPGDGTHVGSGMAGSIVVK